MAKKSLLTDKMGARRAAIVQEERNEEKKNTTPRQRREAMKEQHDKKRKDVPGSLLKERMDERLGHQEEPAPQENPSAPQNAVSDKDADLEFLFGESDHRTQNAPQGLGEETPYEDELNDKAEQEERRSARKRRRARTVRRVFGIIMIAGCIYLMFLIYGVLNTKYIYNDAGQVVPQKLTIDGIRQQKEFELVLGYYQQTRSLYEQVLLLDYRVGAGAEDPVTFSYEYEDLLNPIEKLALQLEAFEPSSRYVQVMNQLKSWVENDIAIYCQKMNSAISQNNAADMEVVLEYNTLMYNDFSSITANLIAVTGDLDGVDYGDLLEWSPQAYVTEQTGSFE